MSDNAHKSIEAAINRLQSGVCSPKKGRITAGSVAKEAHVSRATLYRIMMSDEAAKGKGLGLWSRFEKLRDNGATVPRIAPETIEEALSASKSENKALRSKIRDLENFCTQQVKLRSQMTYLFHRVVKRLEETIKNNETSYKELESKLTEERKKTRERQDTEFPQNVTPFKPRPPSKFEK